MNHKPQLNAWHLWFAWKPVTSLRGSRLWLEYVWRRRRVSWHPYHGEQEEWEYDSIDTTVNGRVIGEDA